MHSAYLLSSTLTGTARRSLYKQDSSNGLTTKGCCQVARDGYDGYTCAAIEDVDITRLCSKHDQILVDLMEAAACDRGIAPAPVTS